MARFPEMKALGAADQFEGWAFIEIVPFVISVLDYTKGFGHTELIELTPPAKRRAQPRAAAKTQRGASDGPAPAL